MKRAAIIILILFLEIGPLFAQQYGWIDLRNNIPVSANSIRDAFFIGQGGWITGGYSSEMTVYYTSDGGQSFTSQNVPAVGAESQQKES